MKFTLNMGDDGILRVKFVGDLEKEDWLAYLDSYQSYLNATTTERPLHFLVDTEQMGKISALARRSLLDSFRNPDPHIGKTAMVGASPYIRVLIGFILKATGRQDIRLFATEEEALAWLRGETDKG